MKSNPFSTHCISPTKCEFELPSELRVKDEPSLSTAIEKLKCKFLRIGSAAQIVGPHGCGKSTLAQTLAIGLTKSFVDIQSVTLRTESGQKFVSSILPLSVHWNLDCPQCRLAATTKQPARRLLILDGIESLSPLHRRLLVLSCARKNTSLLLTTHRAMAGIKVLVALRPELFHFQRIVYGLQKECAIQMTDAQINAAFQQFHGDYRLGLRYLYDVYEMETERRNGKLAS